MTERSLSRFAKWDYTQYAKPPAEFFRRRFSVFGMNDLSGEDHSSVVREHRVRTASFSSSSLTMPLMMIIRKPSSRS